MSAEAYQKMVDEAVANGDVISVSDNDLGRVSLALETGGANSVPISPAGFPDVYEDLPKTFVQTLAKHDVSNLGTFSINPDTGIMGIFAQSANPEAADLVLGGDGHDDLVSDNADPDPPLEPKPILPVMG